MDSSSMEGFEPFALLTSRLILIPTPIAVNLPSYRLLYAGLHADVDFCEMAFGPHFPARNWSDEETRQSIETRDIGRSWKKYGLGDFAVGVKPPSACIDDNHSGFSILKGHDFETNAGTDGKLLEEIEWVGYAGVRDATTTSLPPRETDDPELPPWQEMVEIRYGISSKYWGKAIAKEAAEAVVHWAVKARGVRRFIAETERENHRSAGLLKKLGFSASGTNYWKEPSEVEWELIVQ
ncbi:GNAT domain-containing protein [Aspergillus pseudodeflectus]|uniref:GNAT domain-containing protein n=1 Tax=Aspergillus pseudodeflectus TaxID=176178 RepID=A0ABR4L9E9_9EURO